jgi:PAS domain S-box-containing protein
MRQPRRNEHLVKGSRANRPKARKPAGPPNADLERQVDTLTRELKEANERQAATAEVLKVISRSAFDLQTVLKTLVESAVILSGARTGTIFQKRGELYHLTAEYGYSPEMLEYGRAHPIAPGIDSNVGRTALTGAVVQIPDVLADPDFKALGYQRVGKFRAMLGIPIIREGVVEGVFSLAKPEPGLFAPRQVELVQSFADQALIAIENTRLFNQIKEALDHQTATSEVLGVISSSIADPKPVFERIVDSIERLFDFKQIGIFLAPGDGLVHMAARRGSQMELIDSLYPQPVEQSAVPVVIGARRQVYYPDVLNGPNVPPTVRRAAEISGNFSDVLTPMLWEGQGVGMIAVTRQPGVGFSDRELKLLRTFADQAVVAIENARLFNEVQAKSRELEEALQQQTATAEVLKVISRSAFDLRSVLQTLARSAAHLCEADKATITRQISGVFYRSEAYGFSEEFMDYVKNIPVVPERGSASGRALLENKPIHILDVQADPEYTLIEGQKLGGYRSVLAVPILREGVSIGVLSLVRSEVRPFGQKQIELVSTFADQAAIAIENARLVGELRQRQAELARSVEDLSATSDVLKIISRSTVDLETVLDTLLQTVARLCRADQAFMFRRHSDGLHNLIAAHGASDEARAYIETHPFVPDRGTTSGRAALERRPIHIPDVLADPDYTYTEGQRVAGYRTILGLPLLREDNLVGIFVIARTRVDPFTDREVELAATFADQAVIAIENARLFEELRDRQAELRVTFENMGDGVAMFDAAARLAAWNRNFQEILELPDAFLAPRPSYGEFFRYLADRGEYSADLEAQLSRANEDPRQELMVERTRPDGRVIEVRRNPVPGGGFVLIYADVTKRKQTEEAIRAARDAAETALRELQLAQASLVHAQKMAALGQLTAGIAHEIKNPLNFVNNFSALSAELVDEMNEVLEEEGRPGHRRKEFDELREMLKSNLEKIVQHGKRADSIVKNMLMHSRSGSGEHRSVEINNIIEESLNLAYHGARAEKPGFNITVERDLDPAAGVADIYPQEITRVLLNLISNGFYAATKRASEAGDGFEPKLHAMTRNLGEEIEIRIRDNGTGITSDIKEKIFNPFFTTKPAGEGTGLGLSMSHDIVVKQHGGTIDLLTEPGDFTEFIIRLCRTMPVQPEFGEEKK